MKIQTILVPTDFSGHAQRALQTAVELAKTFGARVEVLHAHHAVVLAGPPMRGGLIVPEGFFERVHQQAEQQLAVVVKEASGQGVDVAGQVVENHPSAAITEAAERLSADLIVMGTRGLTGLKHVALGSVAERTVRTAPCPVLTLKDGE